MKQRPSGGRRLDVLLIQHSHTDIGYTAYQDRALSAQAAYLERAVELCEETAGKRRESQFRWTCETSVPVAAYLSDRSPRAAARLVRCLRTGAMEATAMPVHFNNIYTMEELIRGLAPVEDLRRAWQIPVRVAMQCDVAGIAWGAASVLPRIGVPFLYMAVNETRAKVPPRPRAFWWEGPDGSRMLVWNGEHYMYGYLGLGLEGGVEAFRASFAAYWGRLRAGGYPYDFVVLPVSAGDNFGPTARFVEVAEEWNARYGREIRLLSATPSEIFRRLRRYAPSLSVHRGDWSKWWDDGCASTAYELGVHREAQALVQDAAVLAGLRGDADPARRPEERLSARAYRHLLWFDEHTWGSWCSVADPAAETSRAQWHWKANHVHAALSAGRDLLHRGLDRQDPFAWKAETLWVWNALGWERSGLVEAALPSPWVGRTLAEVRDEQSGEEVPFVVTAGHTTGFAPPIRTVSFVARAVPAFGYARYQLIPSPAGAPSPAPVTRAARELAAGGHRVLWEGGRVVRWTPPEEGENRLDPESPYGLLQVVEERADGLERREALFRPPVFPAWGQPWGSQVLQPALRRTALPWGEVTGETAPGVWQALLLTGAREGVRLRARIMVVEGLPELRCEVEWEGPAVPEPRSWHVLFPFRLDRPAVWGDVPGGAMRPEADQVPGSCRDWLTVRRWVDLSAGGRGVTWCPVEAPLALLDGLVDTRWRERWSLDKGVLASWIMNNHWFTNYQPQQGGAMRFRYVLAPYLGAFEGARAARAGLEAHHPLRGTFAAPERSLPEPSASLFRVDPPAEVTAFEPVGKGRWLLRGALLRPAAGGLLIESRRVFRRAWEATPTGFPLRRLRIRGNRVAYRAPSMVPFSLILE